MQQSLDASSLRLERLLVSDGPTPSELADRNERAVRVAEALRQLSDLQREAIELHYWHGWTLQRIADQMGKSKSAVAGNIRSGLKLLKDRVDER